ncbi:MAG TPA: hypothetical protein VGE01_00735 [Fimbriimonas sp.]
MPRVELQWVVGHASSPETEPEEWVPASVPGNVQADWARAKGLPDWWVGSNVEQYRWMEDEVWVYRTVLPALPPAPQLVLNGVSHHAEIRLNGAALLDPFGQVESIVGWNARRPVDLSLASPGDGLEIVVSTPRIGAWAGNDRTRSTTMPGVFYGWDFAPRLVPVGLWNGAWIESDSDPQFSAYAEFDAGEWIVWASIFSDEPWAWTVLDPDGTEIYRYGEGSFAGTDTAIIPNPQLWQPNGHGAPTLYTARFESGDTVIERRVGLRTVALVPYEGMWREGRGAPGTRWEPPITIEVNGRTIFAKGANWVPPSMLPGTDSGETYEGLLRQCKDGGFNLIRVWGGGNAPKDEFFDLCDEMGILVWQEFPLACGRYVDDGSYQSELDDDSQFLIDRLKHHPSVAVWCGGNELFCPWSAMTDQDAALRLLARNCYDLDPDRPFLPTSPLMGMAHGGYTFVYHDGREGMRAFQESSATAYTEFGSSGPASVEVLRTFVPEEELWPPRKGTAWETHHGFRAWDGHPDSWLMLPMLEEYFGPFESLEEMVRAGQLLQSEGMRHKYEEARRQKPRCSMALAWCLNEPWPTAANNSLISWPAVPKPAMAAVAQACRPTILSLRIPRFRWSAGEEMRVEPFVLNDAYESFEAGEAVVSVDGVEAARWTFAAVPENQNVQGEPLSFALPSIGRTFELTIACSDRPGWVNRYTLAQAAG